MTDSAADVFLSYKAEDRARLKPLVAALEAEGLTLWWDANIGGGANWQQDIENHLDSAKCVIVVWSNRSVGPHGHFVRDEARRAQRRGAYLPIRLDAVEPPLGFGEIQALPLKGWKGDRSDPRFQAVVAAIRSCIAGKLVSRPRASLLEPRLSRRGVIGGATAAAVLAGIGGWLLLRPAPVDARRIAVLPFTNLSMDSEQTYFAEGVAEELRSALSRIGLQVIGRASSNAVNGLDSKAAASKLGVANILTGSIRRSPETIRVNAQLVGGSDGVDRWAQSYDRAPGDAIKIQTDIAINVAQALSIALGQAGRAALALGGTADAGAQDFYLQAGERSNTVNDPESARKVIDLLDAALTRDPNYGNAYALKARALEILASSYAKNARDMAESLGQAEAAARRAIAVSPKLGSAYTALALIAQDRLDFAAALRFNRRALALSPEDPNVLSPATLFTQHFGDAREALQLADHLVGLDPLHAISYGRRAEILITLRQYPQSISASRKSLELAPQLSLAHSDIGDCLTLMNQWSGARAEYERAPPDDWTRLTGEGLVAARSGNRAAAIRTIAHMRKLFGAQASYQYATIYAQMADNDQAFAQLENAVQAKDPGVASLKVDPFFDPIRSDPRYASLLRQLNFP